MQVSLNSQIDTLTMNLRSIQRSELKTLNPMMNTYRDFSKGFEISNLREPEKVSGRNNEFNEKLDDWLSKAKPVISSILKNQSANPYTREKIDSMRLNNLTATMQEIQTKFNKAKDELFPPSSVDGDNTKIKKTRQKYEKTAGKLEKLVTILTNLEQPKQIG